MLTLEGAQAGLSWITILRKRPNYRRAFDRFDPVKIARYDKRKIASLLQDEGIVRNRLKVESTVDNAKVFLELRAEHGTFSRFIWSFVGGEPRINNWKRMADVPAKTAEAEVLSKALKQAGMRFVGPTIVYALMQSIGMVNDHTTDCFRHGELGGATSARR
jgi:DNA-3-methyladenine glycosylase I